MQQIRKTTTAYAQTLAFGAAFARLLRRGDTVCLFGELGSGKTAFVKGLARGLKIVPARVHSPTFTLMNIYEGRLPLYHFDLYRIGAADLLGLGYEEFFYGNGVTAVEWAERLEDLLPAEHWHVILQHAGQDKRTITITARGRGLSRRLAGARPFKAEAGS